MFYMYKSPLYLISIAFDLLSTLPSPILNIVDFFTAYSSVTASPDFVLLLTESLKQPNDDSL
jgi:hypothetical protein